MERSQIWHAALALAFLAAPAIAGDDVMVLTEATFEKEVGQDRGALVEFYAPCLAPPVLFAGVAPQLLATVAVCFGLEEDIGTARRDWRRLESSRSLKNKRTESIMEVVLGVADEYVSEIWLLGENGGDPWGRRQESEITRRVDCDDQKSLCSKYGVQGYPSIQWFSKGSLKPKNKIVARHAEGVEREVELSIDVAESSLPMRNMTVQLGKGGEELNAVGSAKRHDRKVG
ncbi:Protein disulfide-isomerase like 2-1 [Platanthera guangdongensis]|uniref:Protein disulfide-isomerase like 2-1 n=1 Tax=Platanthera guangdongensis TaxID=2320717 RepID=A0ABR2MVE2_9ASPA